MDSKIKQRLVGSIIILGLVAILLPMVFHGGSVKEQNIDLSSAIPTPPAKPNVDIIVVRQEQLLQRKQEEIQHSHTSVEQKNPIPAPQPQTAPNVAAAPGAVMVNPPTAPAVTEWMVQLAAFHQYHYADKLRKRLEAQSYPARIIITKTKTGSLYKVLVGPVADEKAAKNLQLELANVVKSHAIVVPVK